MRRYNHAQNIISKCDSELPFMAIVGNKRQPGWLDTAVGYAAFYHRLYKKSTIQDAVEAMKCASGNNNFEVRFGEEIQESYVNRIKRIKKQQLRLAVGNLLRKVN